MESPNQTEAGQAAEEVEHTEARLLPTQGCVVDAFTTLYSALFSSQTTVMGASHAIQCLNEMVGALGGMPEREGLKERVDAVLVKLG